MKKCSENPESFVLNAVRKENRCFEGSFFTFLPASTALAIM
ncbi:hypothetical protein ADIARSV_4092 [Arcticibacter svalbardensis MN12-7]|uniref:Uncharacterized protein n=1 Tax=Arcticibacter svalbardensis MN12-7 TaxID=1150600 RepID=R9GMP7_9SPHI|nr:hypothetical protein ADIARSV_4092 [Arcticibacter svalbardensis MN12-7]